MLEACGMASTEELFSHLPEAVRLKRPLDLAPGISEYEIVDYFRWRAAENANGTHRSWARASTTISARCWWMPWFRAASS